MKGKLAELQQKAADALGKLREMETEGASVHDCNMQEALYANYVKEALVEEMGAAPVAA